MRYPTPPNPPTDIATALEADHQAIERDLGTLEAGAPAGASERRKAAGDVAADLASDAAVKEAHLYPFMRKFLPDGEEVARRQVAGNGRVERELKELESAEDERFEVVLARLTAQVRARFAEEARILPKLVAATTARQRREHGRRLLTAKRTAPTRAHPDGPDEPPMNRIAHRGLALADRLRDAAEGRRR
ncbi:hypothetical protein CLV63_105126 [Murinocardiopsis flavida]|uniref:Hemerythrin HHE cation binding domain-containing protein n=1 Tax=Murinocardiopsis flavida TaxID=645275 RepID=A0A2P8DML9_9ACTN|nr:hemerythrin domain-containing protein [Murinocardiopsis flavida]PSK98452.1 hypothetical protein CLV63_105126 [Murinocardiopsis flavida]